MIDDGDVRILHGDALAQLATLPSESVHCIVTSPPFWALRDYGTGTWDGGDEGCDHLKTPHGRASSTLRSDGRAHTGPYEGEKATRTGTPYQDVCGKCGARRIDNQIGLEATPSCAGIGTGLMRLRSDLTADQRAYVARRLAEEASRDA